MDKIIIKWEAPEYEYIPKSNNWFWSVGIIAIGLSVASILFSNILFAILITLSAFTLIIYGARRPKKTLFSLTPRGLQIEKKLYPYDNLNSFWIHYDPPHKKLLMIEPKKTFMPAISIPLENIDPNEIREYLLKFVKEERNEESIAATITKILGF